MLVINIYFIGLIFFFHFFIKNFIFFLVKITNIYINYSLPAFYTLKDNVLESIYTYISSSYKKPLLSESPSKFEFRLIKSIYINLFIYFGKD